MYKVNAVIMQTNVLISNFPPDRDHLTKSHHAGRKSTLRVGVFCGHPVTFVP